VVQIVGRGAEYLRGSSVRGFAVAAMLFAVVAAGCGSSAVTTPGSTAAGPGTTGGPAATAVMSQQDALLTYGYGPSPSPSVKFQPDVVIVGGGSASIRWASDDGHTWAIDPAAPGAAALKVGSVMFLTSRAVGRVAEIHDQDGNRVVSLAPVQLTELFSDADFNLDQPVDLTTMNYQALPVLPGDATDLSATPSTGVDGGLGGGASPSPSAAADITAPTVRLVAARGPATAPHAITAATTATQLPPVAKSCFEVGLAGAWTIKPCVQELQISLGVDYKTASGGVSGGGLKWGGSIALKVKDLHTLANFKIQAGNLLNSTVLLEGITGIDVSLGAGVADGVKDDKRLKFEVPIEVETPIPPSPATLGIPLNLVLEFKAIVEVALSGKNSTLQADASYNLDGPIGVRDGSVVAPTLTVGKSILDSITGITLGPSGIVFAAKFKMHLGVGMDGFIAGPYAVTDRKSVV
jgi:hypothetical protein